MKDAPPSGSSAQAVEDMLRTELAQGDVILSTARPILRHLLANDDRSLFSDEVIARVRGIMAHLARQMLHELARALGDEDAVEWIDQQQDKLATQLLKDSALLGHVHALTLEAQLADRLQSRTGIDAVLSPLLQELAASGNEAVAASAMRVIASQARFMQHQRRMELPLGELPADLFCSVTSQLKESQTDCADEAAAVCEQLRDGYVQSERRIAQISRLVMAMGQDAKQALRVDKAGPSIFVTALSMACEQDREIAVLSLGENQSARLAISLRAAGLEQTEVEKHLLYLHPDTSLPDGFDELQSERAVALLNAAGLGAVH